ncbi:hypothetical protein OAG24_00330 [bacterium]|nr:hypothetical protein [bacterium]
MGRPEYEHPEFMIIMMTVVLVIGVVFSILAFCCFVFFTVAPLFDYCCFPKERERLLREKEYVNLEHYIS